MNNPFEKVLGRYGQALQGAGQALPTLGRSIAQGAQRQMGNIGAMFKGKPKPPVAQSQLQQNASNIMPNVREKQKALKEINQ